MPRRGTAGALALACAATACAGPVSVADPEASSVERDVCARVMAHLPEKVLGQPRREVRPGVLTAAWGDPPITLACGVDLPPGMADDTRCFEVNGVGWFAEEGQGGWLFTTIGREVPVQLGVPAKYAPEANALVDVAGPIAAHDKALRPCL